MNVKRIRTRTSLPSGVELLSDCPDGDGPSPRVVFVHGAMDRSTSFGRSMRHLPEICADRYDRRGYGRSLALAPTDLDGGTQDLVDALGERPATVVGHSLGGLVALTAAQRRPDLVRSVLAYEPPLPWEPFWSAGHRQPSGPKPTPEDAAEQFLRHMLGDRLWERFPPSLKAERRSEGVALRADLSSAKHPPAGFDLAEVRVPVVVGCGDRAEARHRMAAEMIADTVPDGVLVVLDDADHGAHLSHPAAFAALVRQALELAEQPT